MRTGLFSHRCTPDDPAATDMAGSLAHAVTEPRENDDGSCWGVWALADGTQITGTIEQRGDLLPGGHYRFLGRWEDHARFGWRFKFNSVIPEAPSSTLGLIDYLHRHCDGVGPVTAARLVERYGEEVVNVLLSEPQRVAEEDDSLSFATAQAAAESLRNVCDPALRQAHLDLHSLFRGRGFYRKAIGASLKRWGGWAAERVRRDPFLLMTAGIPSAGFLRCDGLYLHLGRPAARLKRQALAAWYAIASLDGDTWLSLGRCLNAVRERIGTAKPRPRRALAMLHRAGLASTRTDAAGGIWVADRDKCDSERVVAMVCRRMMDAPGEWPALPEEEESCSDSSNG